MKDNNKNKAAIEFWEIKQDWQFYLQISQELNSAVFLTSSSDCPTGFGVVETNKADLGKVHVYKRLIWISREYGRNS